MTDVTLSAAVSTSPSPIATLRARHPALASVGIAYVILALVTASLPVFDPRLIDGVSIWAKPAKFFLSAGVFMLTSAWFFGYVRPERRNMPVLRFAGRILIAAAVFELAYITFQAARGEPSHYNQKDLLHLALYGLMGVAATAMLATKIPLAIEIARRPVDGLDPAFRRAVLVGLWMTAVLGFFSGAYLAQQFGTGHNVGAVGGAAPVFGWNRAGGDLRVAHFFGMHAEQVLPVVAALSGAAFGTRTAGRLVIVAATAIAALTALAFVQAVMARPFPFG